MRRVLLIIGILIVGIISVNSTPPNPPINAVIIERAWTPNDMDDSLLSPDTLGKYFNGFYNFNGVWQDTIYAKAKADGKFEWSIYRPMYNYPGFSLLHALQDPQYFRLEACDGNTNDPVNPKDNWQTSAWKTQYKGIKDNEAEASWNYALFVYADSGAGIVLDSTEANGLVNKDPWQNFNTLPEWKDSINVYLNQSYLVGESPIFYNKETAIYISLRIKVDSNQSFYSYPDSTVLCKLLIGFKRERQSDNACGDSITTTVYPETLIVRNSDIDTAGWNNYFTMIKMVSVEHPCSLMGWWDSLQCCENSSISGGGYKFRLPLITTGVADFWVDYVEMYNAQYDSLVNHYYDNQILDYAKNISEPISISINSSNVKTISYINNLLENNNLSNILNIIFKYPLIDKSGNRSRILGELK